MGGYKAAVYAPLTSFDIAPSRTARSELVAQLFAGYAAPEQYTSSAWQGNYTDVYAIAATIYRTLTGTMPVEAISRVSNDNLVAASSLNPSIPKNVSNALSKAMTLSPEKRTETVAGLISEISEVMDFGEAPIILEDEPKVEAGDEPKKKMKDSTKYTLIALGVTVPVLVILIIILMGVLFPSEKPKDNNSSIDINSVFASSDKEEDENSSEVNYLYSIPNFERRNINVTNS